MQVTVRMVPRQSTATVRLSAVEEPSQRLIARDVVARRFLVEGGREQGGEGRLYLARDLCRQQQTVLLKRYHPGVLPDPAARERLAALEHPALVSPYWAASWAGAWMEAMPVAEGGPVFQQERLPLATLKRQVVPGILAGLRALHGAGLIHGDVTAGNLVWRDAARTQAALCDFGLCTLSGAAAPLGVTPGYDAPDGTASPALDYFQLGILLLQLYLGHLPFPLGLPPAEQLEQQLAGLMQHLGPELEAPVRGLLHINPTLRWGESQLAAWLEGRPVPSAVSAAVADRPVAQARTGAPAMPPFQFLGKIYNDRGQLATALAGTWEPGLKRWSRGQLRQWAAEFDLDLANRLQDLEEETRESIGVRFARALIALEPGGPLRLPGGICVHTPAELAAALQIRLTQRDGLDEISLGLIHDWLSATAHTELAAKVLALHDDAVRSPLFALWRLPFLLDEELPAPVGDAERPAGVPALLEHLAADWDQALAVVDRPEVQAWLIERGKGDALTAFAQLRPALADDKDGLTAMLLVRLSERRWPALEKQVGTRVENLLREVHSRLASMQMRQLDASDPLFADGAALSAENAYGSDLLRLMDLYTRIREWLSRYQLSFSGGSPGAQGASGAPAAPAGPGRLSVPPGHRRQLVTAFLDDWQAAVPGLTALGYRVPYSLWQRAASAAGNDPDHLEGLLLAIYQWLRNNQVKPADFARLNLDPLKAFTDLIGKYGGSIA